MVMNKEQFFYGIYMASMAFFAMCVSGNVFFVIGVLGVLSCVGVVMNNFKSVIMSNERIGVLCPHAYTIYFFKN